MRKEIQVGKFAITLGEEWSEWFQKGWNWKNFTLIQAAYEDEICMGSREVVVSLFGFRMWVNWVYDANTPTRIEMYRRLDEWRAANPTNEGREP